MIDEFLGLDYSQNHVRIRRCNFLGLSLFGLLLGHYWHVIFLEVFSAEQTQLFNQSQNLAVFIIQPHFSIDRVVRYSVWIPAENAEI